MHVFSPFGASPLCPSQSPQSYQQTSPQQSHPSAGTATAQPLRTREASASITSNASLSQTTPSFPDPSQLPYKYLDLGQNPLAMSPEGMPGGAYTQHQPQPHQQQQQQQQQQQHGSIMAQRPSLSSPTHAGNQDPQYPLNTYPQASMAGQPIFLYPPSFYSGKSTGFGESMPQQPMLVPPSSGTWMMMPGQSFGQSMGSISVSSASQPQHTATAPMTMMLAPQYVSYSPPMMVMAGTNTMSSSLTSGFGGDGSRSGNASYTSFTLPQPQRPAPQSTSPGSLEKQQIEMQQNLIRERILDQPEHQLFGYQPPPTQKNNGNAVLFVGQLNYDVTEAEIMELFSFYGTVQNAILFKDTRRVKTRRGRQTAATSHRSTGARSDEETEEKPVVVGSSAFVTYATTQEADLAIMSLHGRYCIGNREKPIQVSYCLKTDIISEYGYRHALRLHAENPANPVPSLPPTSPEAAALAQQLNAAARSGGIKWL